MLFKYSGAIESKQVVHISVLSFVVCSVEIRYSQKLINFGRRAILKVPPSGSP